MTLNPSHRQEISSVHKKLLVKRDGLVNMKKDFEAFTNQRMRKHKRGTYLQISCL